MTHDTSLTYLDKKGSDMTDTLERLQVVFAYCDPKEKTGEVIAWELASADPLTAKIFVPHGTRLEEWPVTIGDVAITYEPRDPAEFNTMTTRHIVYSHLKTFSEEDILEIDQEVAVLIISRLQALNSGATVSSYPGDNWQQVRGH